MTWLMIKEQIILKAHMLICAFNTIQVTVNFYHLVSVQFPEETFLLPTDRPANLLAVLIEVLKLGLNL